VSNPFGGQPGADFLEPSARTTRRARAAVPVRPLSAVVLLIASIGGLMMFI